MIGSVVDPRIRPGSQMVEFSYDRVPWWYCKNKGFNWCNTCFFLGGNHKVKPLVLEDGTPSDEIISPMASPQGIMPTPFQKPLVPLPRL